MTNEEIMACKEPSRELDAMAAEAVGWIATGYWRPSSDIEQAFQLQERIKELGLIDLYIRWLGGGDPGRQEGEVMGMNSWPGGYRHTISQREHEKWNASHYPGTRQLCAECGEPTGRCEEDAIYLEDGHGPLCLECYHTKEAT